MQEPLFEIGTHGIKYAIISFSRYTCVTQVRGSKRNFKLRRIFKKKSWRPKSYIYRK